MATVTKSYSTQFRGLSIAPDGKTAGASVAWQDDGLPKPNTVPGSIRHLRINLSTGAVELNGKPAGSLDPSSCQQAAAVAKAVGLLIQSLKIPTP
jgi:hypothetical protein